MVLDMNGAFFQRMERYRTRWSFVVLIAIFSTGLELRIMCHNIEFLSSLEGNGALCHGMELNGTW